MQVIADLTAASNAFAGLESRHVELIAGCGSTAHFAAGDHLFRSGEAAERFYLVQHGTVALDVIAAGHQLLAIETVQDGELAGL